MNPSYLIIPSCTKQLPEIPLCKDLIMIFARLNLKMLKSLKKHKLADHSGEKKYNRVVCDLNQIMNPI